MAVAHDDTTTDIKALTEAVKTLSESLVRDAAVSQTLRRIAFVELGVVDGALAGESRWVAE